MASTKAKMKVNKIRSRHNGNSKNYEERLSEIRTRRLRKNRPHKFFRKVSIAIKRSYFELQHNCFLQIILILIIFTLSILTFKPNLPNTIPNTSRPADWRIVENNPDYPINSNPNISDNVFVPLKQPWGHVYTPTRILCLIPTLWPVRKKRMELISETYGPGCDKLMWVVDEGSHPPERYAGYDFMILKLSRPQNHTKHVRNIWEKVHRMWTTVYQTPELLNNFEWFLKLDDDTFLVTENMKGFLQYYDPSYPHYLGHAVHSRWKKDNVIFNSGTCYALSRQTIKDICKYLQYLPTVHPPPTVERCVDRVGAGEDPEMGSCLLGIGVRPGNTLDHMLRERFLMFQDTDHVKMYREDSYYWIYKPRGVADGPNCCSPYVVSMHNYKGRDGLKFYDLQKKYNQPKNWSNIILPPRPRRVLYDRNDLDFEIDEYMNNPDPPTGQRIMKDGKEWHCHKCNVGDLSDVWWTEWWDDVDKISKHAKDSYAPNADAMKMTYLSQ